MKNALSALLSKLYYCLPWTKPEEKAVDTLTAFVRDAEHDLFSVLTALQAHLDLFHDEQDSNHSPVTRFVVLNRAVARISADISAITAISDLVMDPPSQQKQMLEGIMQEIAKETQPAFTTSQVSLSCHIATGTRLSGNPVALKVMIGGMVLALLHECHKFETLKIIGRTRNKRVSLSFDTGTPVVEAAFKPWRLGQLRLIPTNGQGLNLAAVAAMAQLHHGQLSVRTFSDRRHGYRLTFNV